MAYRIDFLYHSGFIYENEDCVLIFDYYRDPEEIVKKRLEETKKPVYFFVSHVHGDHFNPAIAAFEEKAAGYIMHRDCRIFLREMNKSHLMDVGESLSLGDLQVKMYGSTDEGGSYLVTGRELSVFHAGDLNWWHWAGEATFENLAAGDAFMKELGKITERQMDVVFFPVDARLQVAREWGVKAFLGRISCRLLVAMHAFGTPWLPSYEFRYLYPRQKLWIPKQAGDSFEGD